LRLGIAQAQHGTHVCDEFRRIHRFDHISICALIETGNAVDCGRKRGRRLQHEQACVPAFDEFAKLDARHVG
jgi:hypothetical protein